MPPVFDWWFLTNLLKSGRAFDGNGRTINNQTLTQILNEITEVRAPYRAEWNGVKFEMVNGVLHIEHNHRFVNGQLQSLNTEPLEQYLMQDKLPGISLDHWLSNANSQGLPVPNTNNGNLYYWCPRSERVARFRSSSDGAVLDCDGGPGGSNPALGVRGARIFSKDSTTLEKEQVTPNLETEIQERLYSKEEIKTALDNAKLSGLTDLVLNQLK